MRLYLEADSNLQKDGIWAIEEPSLNDLLTIRDKYFEFLFYYYDNHCCQIASTQIATWKAKTWMNVSVPLFAMTYFRIGLMAATTNDPTQKILFPTH